MDSLFPKTVQVAFFIVSILRIKPHVKINMRSDQGGLNTSPLAPLPNCSSGG